jgi:hypothetical protein
VFGNVFMAHRREEDAVMIALPQGL